MLSVVFRLSRLVVFLIFLITFSDYTTLSASDPQVACATILDQAMKINRSINSVSLTMLANERINGELQLKKTFFKIEYNPYRVYVKQYFPKAGLEAIYPDYSSSDKIILHWNNLSFLKLHLDPFSKPFRKSGHHTIDKAGFSFTMEVLEELQRKYPYQSGSSWQYIGLVKYADVVCHKIIFDNPDFHYFDYTVKKGDNLRTIAAKYKICDYMIIENNPDIKLLETLNPGLKVKVPSDYAKQIIIYLDKQHLTLIGLKIYDDKGLFEDYTYFNVKINPVFSSLDFDTENPEYGF
jgi:outer membrane lipoprotein-sorting protein